MCWEISEGAVVGSHGHFGIEGKRPKLKKNVSIEVLNDFFGL